MKDHQTEEWRDLVEHTVVHNQSERRFEVNTEGLLSVLEYQQEGEAVIFTHTETPPELRGRGIAQEMAKAALDWAEQNQYKIIPLCSFMASYVQRNPQYQHLLGTL